MKNYLLFISFLLFSLTSYCQPCESNEINIELTTDDFASEISWEIYQDSELISASDITYEDNTVYDHDFCLEDGCYTLYLYDDVNEGWDGCYVNFLINGEPLFPAGLEVAGSLEHDFAVNSNCNPLVGCTDPLAINYNPDAVIDDGSCIYSECDIDFIIIPDTSGLNTIWIIPNFSALADINVLWDFGDGSSSTELFPEHDYADNGPYNLCLTVSITTEGEECEDTFCQWIEGDMIQNGDSTGGVQSEDFNIKVIESSSGSVGIESSDLDNSISVFPNPFTDDTRIHLTVDHSLSSQFLVFDIQGKLLISENVALIAGKNSIALPFADLESGIYLLQLRTEKGNFTRKLVKK